MRLLTFSRGWHFEFVYYRNREKPDNNILKDAPAVVEHVQDKNINAALVCQNLFRKIPVIGDWPTLKHSGLRLVRIVMIRGSMRAHKESCDIVSDNNSHHNIYGDLVRFFWCHAQVQTENA